MAMPTVSAPAWARWSSSAAVLRFLLVAGAFWLAALVLWQVGRWDLAVVTSGLGAAVPLVVLYATVHARPRLWVLRIAGDGTSIDSMIRRALDGGGVDAVAPSSLPPGHPLRRCGAVLRSSRFGCMVGWMGSDRPPHPAVPERPAILLLLPEGEETAELEALRDTIIRSLVG